jgi:hypothetical protein
MNRIALLFAPIVVAGLSACASLDTATAPGFQPDAFERLHAGLSQDEVRNVVGAPDTITYPDRAGDRVWIYERSNAWDSRAEWDVTVGADGTVKDVASYHE